MFESIIYSKTFLKNYILFWFSFCENFFINPSSFIITLFSIVSTRVKCRCVRGRFNLVKLFVSAMIILNFINFLYVDFDLNFQKSSNSFFRIFKNFTFRYYFHVIFINKYCNLLVCSFLWEWLMSIN